MMLNEETVEFYRWLIDNKLLTLSIENSNKLLGVQTSKRVQSLVCG